AIPAEAAPSGRSSPVRRPLLSEALTQSIRTNPHGGVPPRSTAAEPPGAAAPAERMTHQPSDAAEASGIGLSLACSSLQRRYGWLSGRGGCPPPPAKTV